MSDWNVQVIEEFRANEGKVGGYFEGRKLALITHRGARSGQERVNPLAYVPDGDRIAIIASAAGADKHPAWYYNIVANPDVTVEVGTEKYEATAAEVTGEERDRLYAAMVEIFPSFAEYQEKTDRKIPVLALERKA